MAIAPGSSVQVYPHGQPIGDSLPIHEAAHSLRFARTGGETTGTPLISPEKATSVRIQAMKSGVPFAWDTDPIHAALDALSGLRAGGSSGISRAWARRVGSVERPVSRRALALVERRTTRLTFAVLFRRQILR